MPTLKSRIDLVFSKDQTADDDTAAGQEISNPASASSSIEESLALADLTNLTFGTCTIPEVVQALEITLGQRLSSNITQQGGHTRISLALDQSSQDPNESPYYSTDGGTFHTSLVRHPSTEHRLQDHMFIRFRRLFEKPPSIILGLNYIETARGTNVRTKATAEMVNEHLFDLYSRAWGDTKLFGVGFTWLAVPDLNPLLQVGTYKTTFHNGTAPPTHQDITFKHPYKTPPKVIVWLNLLEFSNTHNERVMTYITGITTTGFTVHVNNWGDTKLHQAGISWFAHPTDSPGICSGEILPKEGTVGMVKFEKRFSKPPRRVLLGLTKLEIDKKDRFRFKIVHEALSEVGMGVRMETWGGSLIHTMGVSYVAME